MKPAVIIFFLILTAVSFTGSHSRQSPSDRNYFTDYRPAEFFMLPELNAPFDFAAPDLNLLNAALFHAVNAEREKRNLKPLAWNTVLYRTAEVHARDMAELGFFSHYNPVKDEHKSLDQRILLFGKPRGPYAENIAKKPGIRTDKAHGRIVPSVTGKGFRDEKGRTVPAHSARSLTDLIMAEWMSSPEAESTILNPQYLITGVASDHFRDARNSGLDTFTVVQVFAVSAAERK